MPLKTVKQTWNATFE